MDEIKPDIKEEPSDIGSTIGALIVGLVIIGGGIYYLFFR